MNEEQKKKLEEIDKRQHKIMQELTDNICALKSMAADILHRALDDPDDEIENFNPEYGYAQTIKLITQDLDRLQEELDHTNIDLGKVIDPRTFEEIRAEMAQ
jgi:hypothetical protein